MTQALVTGATGFIGGRLVDRLLVEGWDVTVLARNPDRLHPRHLGRVSVLKADLAATLPALPEVAVLFHCAADMDFGRSTSQMGRTTIGGTQKLLAAARDAGVGRFVHLSSQAVYGFDRHYEGADEETPMRASPWPYCETKRLAEEAVWEAGREGLEVVVLRPGFVYGPGDLKTIPPVLKAIKAGQIKAHIDHGAFDTGCVHVDNCVDGMLRAAMTAQAAGQVYHLGDGRVLTIKQMVDSVCGKVGIKAPSANMPYALAMALGSVVETGWKVFRQAGPAPMSPFTVAMLRRNSGFSIEKARRELGYQPVRQWEESLDELIAWCEECA